MTSQSVAVMSCEEKFTPSAAVHVEYRSPGLLIKDPFSYASIMFIYLTPLRYRPSLMDEMVDGLTPYLWANSFLDAVDARISLTCSSVIFIRGALHSHSLP